VADTALDIITQAFLEAMIFGPIDLPLKADDAQFGLKYLQQLMDQRAALKRYAYNVNFALYTLTPNHHPTLIGPGLVAPDFAAAQRPVRIEGASLVLNNVTPKVDSPIINIRDDDWWRGQSVKDMTTAVPTDLYYSPNWPNGELNFWPVPNYPYQVRLELWGLLTDFVALNTPFSLPPAYKRATVLRLGKMLCRPYGKTVDTEYREDLRYAEAALESNNIGSPRIQTADYGTAGRPGGRRGNFNYYSGQ
jgi:hypothetical protein